MSSSNNVVVSVRNVGKVYRVFQGPQDRLRRAIAHRVGRILGRGAANEEDVFWALRGVSFDVLAGESVGIVGRNGAGKSTLLQIICGTLQPSSGTCVVNGSVAALLELGSGFNPEFTGLENVRLYGQVLGMRKRQMDEMLNSILEFADIGDFVHRPVKTYSSGMVVRLAFAVSVARQPDVLIVDEALAVGDEAFKRKCFARIEDLRKSGTTLLFVSHSASLVAEICNRVLVIDGGELIYSGEPKSALSWYTKLLFASSEDRQRVRDAMVAMISGSVGNVSDTDGSVLEDNGDPGAHISSEEEADDFFAPSLKSESRLEYEQAGARIFAEGVFSEDGRAVNVLLGGRIYEYRYRVEFTHHALNVGFGMMIRSISGFEIGGAVYPGWERYIGSVSAGQEVTVAFRFRCMMNPGVYFLNAGVQGQSESAEGFGYLHRILDAVMVKVMPARSQVATGMIDLDVSAHIEPKDL